MSLLSSFLASQLIPALEQAFIAHEPDMQDMLLNEVKALTEKVVEWVNAKAAPKAE